MEPELLGAALAAVASLGAATLWVWLWRSEMRRRIAAESALSASLAGVSMLESDWLAIVAAVTPTDPGDPGEGLHATVERLRELADVIERVEGVSRPAAVHTLRGALQVATDPDLWRDLGDNVDSPGDSGNLAALPAPERIAR